MRLLVITISALAASISSVSANSFTQETGAVFKLNNPALQLSAENSRFAFNRALSGSASSGGGSGLTINGTYYDKYQYAQPMNNVIQVTENYEIILNGNNNSVTTNGAVLNVDQNSEGGTQNTGNTLAGSVAD